MARGRGRGRGGALLRNLQLGECSSYHSDRITNMMLHQDSDDERLQDALYQESDEDSLHENPFQEATDGYHHEVIQTNEGFNHDTQLSLHHKRAFVEHGPSKRKGRGPAIGMDKPDKECRPVIKFKNGRPVSNNRDCFITKIGIWAKDQSRFPLRTLHFDNLPRVEWERLEKDVDDYFVLDYEGDIQKLIKETCRSIWNNKRSRLYRSNYACHATHEEALRHPPKGMSADTWRAICEDVFLGCNWKERSARNSMNRSRQSMVHKSGRISFAQRAVTLRNEIQRSPTRVEVFKTCYKGQKGYANAATEEATERLVAMASQNPENEDLVFQEVLGPERKGRKRGMGRGIAMREDNAFLRAQVDELTLQLAERDARDKERDVKDVETRQKLADLEARFESLSQSLIPGHAQSSFDSSTPGLHISDTPSSAKVSFVELSQLTNKMTLMCKMGGRPSRNDFSEHCGRASLSVKASDLPDSVCHLSSGGATEQTNKMSLKRKLGEGPSIEGQVQAFQPIKQLKKAVPPNQYQIDPKTPVVEIEVPAAMEGYESPLNESVVDNSEKMACQADPAPIKSSVKTLLFVKSSILWEKIEAMEVFRRLPQEPSFHQLEQYSSMEIREGMAVGLMLSFANLADSIKKLNIFGPQASFDEKLEALITMEENGFDVRRIRSRIEDLLKIRNDQREFASKETGIEEKILARQNEIERLKTTNYTLDKAIMEVEQKLAQLREERQSVDAQVVNHASELAKLKKDVHETKEASLLSEQRFDIVLDSPW